MNGADALVHTALAAGVDVCFSNPGTTELPLVAALDRVPGMRAVLGVFEGVCTGAADGFGRMADRPALTLLHLGPGFANGIANLHNARRARSPIVNLIGDHATWHLDSDAPLTSDITSLARSVSSWVHTSQTASALPADFATAWEKAAAAPGSVATLIAPADCQWEDCEGPAKPGRPAARPAPAGEQVDSIAVALRSARSPAILLGGAALRAPALRAAWQLASAHGARLVCETFPARLERGGGLPAPEKLPYFPEQAIASLSGVDLLILAGAVDPVAFFGYEGVPSRLAPTDTDVRTLATALEDCEAALVALADALGARDAPPVEAPAPPNRPTGTLDAASLGAALASSQPEGAVVVDEGATSGLPYFLASAGAPAHSYLALTGGAIGQGMPVATGAAVACPDRPVVCLQADGSGLYTAQALWTQAREGLNVVTLLCSNRAYRILQIELARAGIAEPGPVARSLTDLSKPTIDWVALSRGFGVPAERVETAEMLSASLEIAFSEPGPRLIELALG